MNLSSTTLYKDKQCAVVDCNRRDLYSGKYCTQHKHGHLETEPLLEFLKE